MTSIKTLLAIVVLIITTSFSLAGDAFSVEDYGLLPNIRSVSISPDGEHYAFIKRSDEGDLFLIVNIEKNEVVGGANASAVKARSVYFASNNHVILRTSKTRRSSRVKGNWEDSSAIAYNLKTKKMKTLLKGAKDLYIAQSGLGRIVGINLSKNVVYMPAYIGSGDSPSNNLLRVNLDTGRAIKHAKGNHYVIDWFVDANGKVLAREEYRERVQEHQILSKVSGQWKIIYSNKTDIPEIAVVAVSEDGGTLIFSQDNENNEAIYSMSLSDGEILGPLFEQEGSDIDSILTSSLNREFSGVLYSGLLPNYQYKDEKIQQDLAALQEIYPDSEVHPISMTLDKSKIVLKISGNQAAGDYMVFDAKARKLQLIGSAYPNIKKDQIATVKAIRYKARDGLSISAILTEPVGVESKKNLPMIVMPHGGPESYDSIHFDWWAQYFARKGYLILQPNFRGSSGFGSEFTSAGHGKWGREMQDDVSNGVAAMLKAGYADPERVCIMGASYGGYAALAGGAFTPDLYKCVIAVAGVSDLPKMLKDERSDHGKNHWVVSYWNKVIGDSKTEREKLKNISPVNAAANFKAPLLMLHGKDDTVVPIDQSKRMLKAMKKANKPAELITLKGEDHWLSDSDTRLQLLKGISDFLDEHNPVIVN